MINRELKTATLKKYGGVDSYGQPLNAVTETKTIQVAFGLYSQSNVNDIRYADITHYALTKEKVIGDDCFLEIGGVEYKVKIVNNTSRWTQLLLC